MYKKIITIIIFLVVLVGCSQTNKVIFKEISLDDVIVEIKKSEIIRLGTPMGMSNIDTFPDIDVKKAKKVEEVVELGQFLYNIEGQKKSGSKEYFCGIRIYQVENSYYLTTYSYEVKNDGKNIYTPLGLDKETVYLVESDMIQVIEDMYYGL